jgi:hypothetical protein
MGSNGHEAPIDTRRIAVIAWGMLAATTAGLFVMFAVNVATSPVELTTHWGGFGGGLGGWRLSPSLSVLIAAVAMAIATASVTVQLAEVLKPDAGAAAPTPHPAASPSR